MIMPLLPRYRTVSVSYTHLVMETYEVLKKNQYGKYLKDVLDGKYVDKIHPQDI